MVRRGSVCLVDAAREGLERVEITTDLDNVGSQRVIEANGGELIGPAIVPARDEASAGRGEAVV